MVLLTALISCIATISSWTIEKSLKGYFALLLLLNTGMMGVFVALDFFLFYVFWEVMLLPMYFLIGVWGGPRREYAAIKFFLYTLLGSVLMLLAMLALYFSTNVFIDPAGTLVSVTDAMKTGGQGLEKIHTFNLVMMTDPAELHPGILARRMGDDVAVHRVRRTVHRFRHQDSRRSHSTRGCLTHTWKRRHRSASSLPAFC